MLIVFVCLKDHHNISLQNVNYVKWIPRTASSAITPPISLSPEIHLRRPLFLKLRLNYPNC